MIMNTKMKYCKILSVARSVTANCLVEFELVDYFTF